MLQCMKRLTIPTVLLMLCSCQTVHAQGGRVLTNGGPSASQYDVVVVDTGGDNQFTTTTVEDDDKVLGVLYEDVNNGATGIVLGLGVYAQVTVNANISVGDMLITSTTAGEATKYDNTTHYNPFGIAVTAGDGTSTSTQVEAVMLPPASGNALDLNSTQIEFGAGWKLPDNALGTFGTDDDFDLLFDGSDLILRDSGDTTVTRWTKPGSAWEAEFSGSVNVGDTFPFSGLLGAGAVSIGSSNPIFVTHDTNSSADEKTLSLTKLGSRWLWNFVNDSLVGDVGIEWDVDAGSLDVIRYHNSADDVTVEINDGGSSTGITFGGTGATGDGVFSGALSADTLTLRGTDTNNGGKLSLDNAINEDTLTTTWDLEADDDLNFLNDGTIEMQIPSTGSNLIVGDPAGSGLLTISGSTSGGHLSLENNTSGASTSGVSAWGIQADFSGDGQFQIHDGVQPIWNIDPSNNETHFGIYDVRVSNNMDVTGGDLELGSDDTTRGIAKLYGASTTDAGRLEFYSSADDDTFVEVFGIESENSALEFDVDGTTHMALSFGGSLRMGRNDAESGNITIYGSSAKAGSLQLYNDADDDGTVEFWHVGGSPSNPGDFRIEAHNGSGDALRIDDTNEDVHVLNDLNVGTDATVTGTLTANGKLNVGAVAAQTISSGSITYTQYNTELDSEGGAGVADDLDTISGGTDGDVILLQRGNADITAKDGTGNINLTGDVQLNQATERLQLIYDSSSGNWLPFPDYS